MHLNTEAEADLDELTTVKLQIPKRQRLLLHSLKITTGQTMSDIVQEALRTYLETKGHEVS